ncbi:related to SWR1-complex protein 5 [Saccharomycodes ludwigii]|uniref:SWR1-complex protein 5 n=1 Tax=Saccharomycodes ludwigii TaxID=36035 RepID=A0A376B7M8_9ASCO|nr:hypothetical protein SCDLUD_001006 [Saccharomycodes ludwigii]KAH3903375.1 hypothetical protein SCDLUD_001006 [Saccharomycodes ludwigii]SSD60652.1 related to SWR1-complex protein 5 [Saccharomycodes ludwigii]
MQPKVMQKDQHYLLDNQDQYDEELDQDYVLPTEDTTKENIKNDTGYHSVDSDSEDEATKELDLKYSTIVSESGGLVKTRRARQLELENLRKNKYENINNKESNNNNIDTSSISNIWKELKAESENRLYNTKCGKNAKSIMGTRFNDDCNSKNDDSTFEQERIKIKRSYKFAGVVHTEEKWVAKSSAAAKEYLNSLKFLDSAINPEGKNIKNNKNNKITKQASTILRRPLKRPPILEKIIAGSLKPKLSTLEKSKIDWALYVDNQGINDDLKNHNKDGYLAKQDFLNKVDYNRDLQYKKLREKELAEKYK